MPLHTGDEVITRIKQSTPNIPLHTGDEVITRIKHTVHQTYHCIEEMKR